MKKTLKGFILGIIITTLLMSTAFGETFTKAIEVVYNSVNITVNGKKIETDNILYKGTTYVPLRVVAEALGKDVEWDEKTKTVGINDEGYSTDNEDKKSESEYSINNPAPIGVSQTYTMESNLTKEVFEVTVLEVHRGNEAEKIINEKNLYDGGNGLKENAEKILVKIRKENLNNPEDKRNTLIFDVYNGKNESYKSSVITTNSEELKANEEYKIFIIDKEDTNPKLEIYSVLASTDKSNPIWFKLSR